MASELEVGNINISSVDGVLQMGSTAGNGSPSLKLCEQVQSGDIHNGFSFNVDGDGTNNLHVKRHVTSSSGADVLVLDRDSGLATFSSGITVSGDCTFNSDDVLITSDASGKPVLKLQNTYSDPLGPEIVLERLNQFEDNNDLLGTIRFKGDNDAQESTEYATIYSQCTEVDDGLEDGNLIFQTIKDGTLAARLTIGSDGLATFSNGINLGDTTLSNYDEGTWTVGFHDATSGGNASSTTATGNYTRVGRLVTVAFSVFDINISGMTSGNQMYFSLPFAVSSVVCIGSATTRDVELTNGTTINCAFNTGTQRGSFLSAQDNGAWSYPTVGDFSGTGDVYVTGQYMI